MSEASPNQSIIFFTSSLVHQLSTKERRLEPTYVGVRRVRPSSREVKDAFVHGNRTTTIIEERVSPLTFKVVGEDGVERRMTSKEKKALKFQIAQQKKQEKEKRRIEKEEQESAARKEAKKRKTNNEGEETATAKPTVDDGSEDDESAMEAALSQVGVAPKKLSPLEQEIADLRGERNGVPPVIIPAPLAQVALTTPNFLPGNEVALPSKPSIWIDDDLAQEWSDVMKESMNPSIEVRQKEDMRRMVYQIIPEPWKRLRPDSIRSGVHPPVVEKTPQDVNNTNEDSRQSWELVTVRPPSLSTFDSDTAIVAEVLHRHTSLHVSCGAKFGSDFLVYDGPRSERHAFAGLRVMNETDNTYSANSSSGRSFPVPPSYGMAGYVRCLNTAAKLALVAMVKREEGEDGSLQCRVAFVDLKLERVDGTKRKDLNEKLQKLQKS